MVPARGTRFRRLLPTGHQAVCALSLSPSGTGAHSAFYLISHKIAYSFCSPSNHSQLLVHFRLFFFSFIAFPFVPFTWNIFTFFSLFFARNCFNWNCPFWNLSWESLIQPLLTFWMKVVFTLWLIVFTLLFCISWIWRASDCENFFNFNLRNLCFSST